MKIFGDRGGQCPPHIENSQLIYRANQLTGFYVRRTLTVKGLIIRVKMFQHQGHTNKMDSEYLDYV